MHNMLVQILQNTKKSVEVRKHKIPLARVRKNALAQRAVRDFYGIFSQKQTAIILEIKRASPTMSAQKLSVPVVELAAEYYRAGASAISVITEEKHFLGNTRFVTDISSNIPLPVLQKDFVIHEYQIYEARTIGSSAILLIARFLSAKKLMRFVQTAQKIGVEPVVEIHSDEDLQKAVKTLTRIIAVNARDLDTFSLSVPRAAELVQKIPGKFVRLGFSGVVDKQSFDRYVKAGVRGVLIGSSVMQRSDVSEFITSLQTK